MQTDNTAMLQLTAIEEELNGKWLPDFIERLKASA